LAYCYITETTHNFIVTALMEKVTLGVPESDVQQIRVCVPYDSTRRRNLDLRVATGERLVRLAYERPGRRCFM